MGILLLIIFILLGKSGDWGILFLNSVIVSYITVVLLVDEALVQEGVHLLEGASLLEGVHLPGKKVLKEMVMVLEGLQLLGVFHQEVDLLIHEAHHHKIQMM